MVPGPLACYGPASRRVSVGIRHRLGLHKHAEYHERYGSAAADPANARLTFIRLASRRDVAHFPADPLTYSRVRA